MKCPFLQEARVKFCGGAAYKKMIVENPGQSGNEKCSTSDYKDCQFLKRHHEDAAPHSHCPFLQESLVQYCSAASVTKYIPYSESLLSRCGTETHRYCEIYLSMAEPSGKLGEFVTTTEESVLLGEGNHMEHTIEGIRMPGHLAYSANHMWLDRGNNGSCYVGIDAFMARVLGSVDRLNFVTVRDVNKPTAILSVDGFDMMMTFPLQMQIKNTNNYLRANPGKLIASPYKLGWLFEGVELKGASAQPESDQYKGMMQGEAARKWMEGEVRRLAECVHQQIVPSRTETSQLVMDGGLFVGGLIHQLNIEEKGLVYSEFFSPYASWRKWW